MNLIYAAVCLPARLMLVLAGVTRVGAWLIERRNPPVGSFADDQRRAACITSMCRRRQSRTCRRSSSSTAPAPI